MLEAPVVGGVVRIVKECRGDDPVVLDSVEAKELVYLEPQHEFGRENHRTGSLSTQSFGDIVRDSASTSDLVEEAVRDAMSRSDLVGEVVRDSISCSEMLGDTLPRSSSLSFFKPPSV